MIVRYCAWGLFLAALACQTGCCGSLGSCVGGCDLGSCSPYAGQKWCDCSCGQFWWHEWFSHPPDCEDPCTQCGTFACSNNRWVRHGAPPMGRPCGGGYGMSGDYGDYSDGGYESSNMMTPTPAPSTGPTPADPARESGADPFVDEMGRTIPRRTTPGPSRQVRSPRPRTADNSPPARYERQAQYAEADTFTEVPPGYGDPALYEGAAYRSKSNSQNSYQGNRNQGQYNQPQQRSSAPKRQRLSDVLNRRPSSQY